MLIAAYERVVPEADASFAFREFVQDGFPFIWHVHPEVELTLVRHSRGRRFVGDDISQYDDGDLVLLGGNLPHTWCSDPAGTGRAVERRERRKGQCYSIVVQFLESFAGSGFFERPELARVRGLLTDAGRGIRLCGRTRAEVTRRLHIMRGMGPLERMLELVRCLDILARAPAAERAFLSGPSFAGALDEAGRQRIDDACGYINANYRRELRLGEVAGRVHLGPSAFSRFFRQATGKSFVDYVIALRVGHACNLLVSTDLPVARIAFETGFFNLANFNRRFRGVKGVAPREYRSAFRRGG